MDEPLDQFDTDFAFGTFSIEGEHHPNEDRFKVKAILMEDAEGHKVFYAGIFDGHGGGLCSEYCRAHMHRNICRELRKSLSPTEPAMSDETVVAALLNGYSKTEEDYLKLSIDQKEFSGACANTILIYRDTIYVANLGDCRAVLGRAKGKTIGLSRDHKASIEKDRIKKVGGFVKNGRVNGVLAISRTIGDREFKNPVAVEIERTKSPTKASSPKPGYQRPGIPIMVRRVSNPSNLVLKNVKESSYKRSSTELRQSSGAISSSSDDPRSPSPGSTPEAPGPDAETREGSTKIKIRPPERKTPSSGLSRSTDSTMETSPQNDSATQEPTADGSGKLKLKSKQNTDNHTTGENSVTIAEGTPPTGDASTSNGNETEDSDGEAEDGLFDVIECFDAESKEKKFGFKKRRPPKDPQYDVATIVSAIPEITIMRRHPDDDFIFLATDGFYDLFSSKHAGTAVLKHLGRNGRDNLDNTVKALCQEAANLGSEDDITGILILLSSASNAIVPNDV